jgi:flagella basal body P-ring formation protein FlgA
MRTLCTALLAISGATAACLPVSGDQILGLHLAMLEPAFSRVPKTLTIAFAPQPGSRRILAATEVARLAQQHGVELETAAEMCFEVPMRALTTAEAGQAMLRSLPSGVQLDILELMPSEVPSGEVVFPAPSLEPGTGERRWHGYIRYTPTKRMTISARIRLSLRTEALVLTSDIPKGASIGPGQFRREVVSGLPVQARVAVREEDLLGTVTRLPLKAGATIPLTALDHPPVVRRGDLVPIDVRAGAAHLRMDAIAQREARDGESLDFLNPQTGRTFRARLEGRVAVLEVDRR